MPTKTNEKSLWDRIWLAEGKETWRTYPGPFGRITFLLERGTLETRPDADRDPVIVDVGCGVGHLLSKVKEKVPRAQLRGVDHSSVALQEASSRQIGIQTHEADLEREADITRIPPGDILLCTETLEHLSDPAVARVLFKSMEFKKCFFMVPNACLGPEVEPQHMRAWTAKTFLDLLKKYHPSARVEVFYDQATAQQTGHRGYLLGITGYPKQATMSFTMPVKDEEEDIERVLASFRGAADEIVIGIDDKTSDGTEEIVRRYADTVFPFTWDNNFSAARNACIDRCTGDWIFMSEGHESLQRGLQALLQLEELPDHLDVIEVRREASDSAWFFPWLFRRKPEIRFQNAVHNVLVGYSDERVAQAPQISTWHERSLKKAAERTHQRQGMNKQELLRRIREEHNIRDMYYLGTEYRDLICPTCEGLGYVTVQNGHTERQPCPDCAFPAGDGRQITTGVQPFGLRQHLFWLQRFITCAKACGLRYQARLVLARSLIILRRYYEAKTILGEATVDDPARIEHWMMLGDVCEALGQMDQALRFYEYAGVAVGRPPVSNTFLEKAMYTYLPAQKLISAYAGFELYDDALAWAKRLPELMPPEAPQEALDEVGQHIASLEELATQSNTSTSEEHHEGHGIW